MSLPRYSHQYHFLKTAQIKKEEAEAKFAPQKAVLEEAKVKAEGAKLFRPIQPGETPDITEPLFGGEVKLRESGQDIFGGEHNKMAYGKALERFDLAKPGDKGAEEWTFGNVKVLLKPRPDSEDWSRQFKNESDLRQEFVKDKRVERFSVQSQALRRIEQAEIDNSGAGDIALVYGFMKLVEPESTVREGEYATAEQAGGAAKRYLNLYNKVLSGQRLDPETRKNFITTGKGQFRAASQDYEGLKKYYSQLALRKGFDPFDVIVPISQIQETSGTDAGQVADELKRRGLLK